MLHTRMLTPADDARIAAIIRANLKAHGLDVPGTVYFDPELDHLSAFYAQNPGKRAYFVTLDDAGQAAGGVGFAAGVKSSGAADTKARDSSGKMTWASRSGAMGSGQATAFQPAAVPAARMGESSSWARPKLSDSS